MSGWTYRLEVEGELGSDVESAMEGMSLRHARGNTVLVGLVRDQAELRGVLQRLSDFGVTLLSVEAIDRPTDRVYDTTD
jgi:hypothetical protein